MPEALHLQLSEAPFSNVAPAVGADGRYRAVSFWQQTVDVEPGEPLSGDLSCDVAIVGGGFSGLSTACELRRQAPELEVVLIEREVIGHGASGRNGGFAMPLIGWDLTHAVGALGEETGKQAYDLMYEAVDYVKCTVAQQKIDCDLEATGYLLLATCPSRERRLRHEAELGDRLGYGYRWLEGGQLDAYIRSPAFRGGVFDPRPAIINPAKLARGLKHLAQSRGAAVYEQTPLVELIDGDPVTLRTPQARIQAKCVVLAVNGYGGAVGFMPARVLPVHTYIVLTEPLSDRQLDEIGWSEHRASLETARNLIHYFRLTADNRILFGGEDAQLYWGGKYRDQNPRFFARLESRLRQYFPTLSDVKITHRWGGVLGVTLDMFPSFGRGGRHGNVFHATAYCGHGVALSNYAGYLLAPHILNRFGKVSPTGAPETPFFFERQPTWLPPDPLRWAGMQLYRFGLRIDDRWRGA